MRCCKVVFCFAFARDFASLFPLARLVSTMPATGTPSPARTTARTNARATPRPGKAPAQARSGAQTVRIIGGAWRSRVIRFPAVDGLRPTGDRLRETLFNWLGQDLEGLRVLDLFAGSGALGFEAASRAASHVCMVERDRQAFAALQATKSQLAASQVTLIQDDALAFLRRNKQVYDVVLIDPPFAANLHGAVLQALPNALAADARIYVESPLDWAFPSGWQVLKALKAGQLMVRLLSRPKDAGADTPLSI
jgi:16S rRNA (guanine966-N2)-methyltransferase